MTRLLAPAFGILAAVLLCSTLATPAQDSFDDVLAYGDSSAAVTAAVAAVRQGRSVIPVNPTSFLGGMSASRAGAALRAHEANSHGSHHD